MNRIMKRLANKNVRQYIDSVKNAQNAFKADVANIDQQFQELLEILNKDEDDAVEQTVAKMNDIISIMNSCSTVLTSIKNRINRR